MNNKPIADFSTGQPRVRRSLRVAVTAVLLASVGTVFITLKHSSRNPVKQRAEGEGQTAEVSGQRSEVRGEPQVAATANPATSKGQPNASSRIVLPTALTEPTPQTRQLVNSLALLDQAGRPMSPE